MYTAGIGRMRFFISKSNGQVSVTMWHGHHREVGPEISTIAEAKRWCSKKAGKPLKWARVPE